MKQFKCPECGESDNLSGKNTPDGILITCGCCKISWLRDSVQEKCATCGGTDIVKRKRALTEYSRGSQLSITGFTPILLCRKCDQRMIKWADDGHPVPFNYRSAAADSDALANRKDDDTIIISP